MLVVEVLVTLENRPYKALDAPGHPWVANTPLKFAHD